MNFFFMKALDKCFPPGMKHSRSDHHYRVVWCDGCYSHHSQQEEENVKSVCSDGGGEEKNVFRRRGQNRD